MPEGGEAMTQKEGVQFWLDSAAEDYDSIAVFLMMRRYSACLSIGNMVLQWLLRACLAKITAAGFTERSLA